MNKAKKKALKKAGWKVGSVDQFLSNPVTRNGVEEVLISQKAQDVLRKKTSTKLEKELASALIDFGNRIEDLQTGLRNACIYGGMKRRTPLALKLLGVLYKMSRQRDWYKPNKRRSREG